MNARHPSSVAARHQSGLQANRILPQGKKESSKEGSEANLNLPSPLEGEGVSRRLTDEGSAGRMLRFAKKLRREMTDVEKKLWSALRDRRFENFKFRRQVPIGNYIVDFVCQERKVIVELDGSQHEGSSYDKQRDAWLECVGYKVLRFWNIDINQALDGTLLAILDALRDPSSAPSGHLLPQGEKEGSKK
jgi:very-short-patch-repair endonuclease